MTIRFQKIDDSNRGDHYHLTPADECLYLIEFTSGQGYSYSKANSLISNLKKKPSASQAELDYKQKAITTCSGALSDALNKEWLATATLVPIPPSKARDHPAYDNRMVRMASSILPAPNVRSLVRQTISMEAAHESAAGARPTVDELIAAYEIDETISNPPPMAIGVLDDVLTAGTHYRAVHTLLSERFPGVPITGIFIARRVFANPTSAQAG